MQSQGVDQPRGLPSNLRLGRRADLGDLARLPELCAGPRVASRFGARVNWIRWAASRESGHQAGRLATKPRARTQASWAPVGRIAKPVTLRP